ncbi:MAG TPA: hypothetical protein VFE79_22370 [Paraburkholderia sp.]|nr:hypothetical protein [Paraburkholderia sp.]
MSRVLPAYCAVRCLLPFADGRSALRAACRTVRADFAGFANFAVRALVPCASRWSRARLEKRGILPEQRRRASAGACGISAATSRRMPAGAPPAVQAAGTLCVRDVNATFPEMLRRLTASRLIPGLAAATRRQSD